MSTITDHFVCVSSFLLYHEFVAAFWLGAHKVAEECEAFQVASGRSKH